LLPAFVRMCNLDASSCAANNPYHTIVRALTPLLLHMRGTSLRFGPVIAFGGRCWTAFRPLLQRKDERALLLLAYWLVLLGQCDQWWMSTRARTECAAIVYYLSNVADVASEVVRALLVYPASFGAAGHEVQLE
jgi:hypothetical protein